MPKKGRGGGGGAGAQEEARGEVVEELCFYEVLSVTRTASDSQIKRAYMRLAKEWHPDRNPAPEAKRRFQQISTAYEVLSEEESRRLYDSYGADVALGKKPRPGMGRFSSRGPAQRQGEDCEARVRVTLAELFVGTTKTVCFSRTIHCRPCEGKGGRSGARRVQCGRCRGVGVVSRMHVMGGMFMQRVDSPCGACEASGATVHPQDACPACRGSGRATEAAKVKVPIPCGTRPDRERVRLGQEGHAAKNCVPGDLVVTLELEEEPDAEMQWLDNGHLVLSKSITLVEALLGFVMAITHLDGRKILVRTAPGEMIRPGDYRRIKGEGMPKAGNMSKRGDLVIEFDVTYPSPEELTEDKVGHLLLGLPGPPPRLAPKDAEEMALLPCSVEEFGAHDEDHGDHGQHGDYDDDDDDSEEYYETGPGCAHQ